MNRFVQFAARVGCVAVLGAAIVSLVPVVAHAAATSAEEGAAGEVAAHSSVPIQVDGRVLIRVRGFAGYTAEERASAVEKRIVEFASDRSVPVDTLHLVEQSRGSEIRAGSVTILTITDADAALEDMSRDLLAGATLEVLQRSIEAWREQRSPRLLLRHAAYAVGATILLAVVLWLLCQGFRQLRAVTRRQAGARVRAVKVAGFEVIRGGAPARCGPGRHQAALLVRAALGGVPVPAVRVALFPWTRPIGDGLLALVMDPLTTLALSFIGALPNVAFLVVLFLVVRYLLKLRRMFFAAIEHGSLRFEEFDPEWAIPTYKVLRIFIVAFAVVVAYPYIPGSDSAAFKGVSVLLGVIFSLGSSSVIGNIIAGYTMTYRRAFRRGDRIKVGDVIGDVIDSRVLVTTLRTPKNEIVVVPNSEILGNSIVNFSSLARIAA